MRLKSKQISEEIKNSLWLSTLSREDKNLFMSTITIAKYNKDDYILHKNQKHYYFYIVVSGQLSVYISDDRDQNKIIKVATFVQNDICGEMALLSDSAEATADVVADKESILIKIPHNISDYFKLRLLKPAYAKIKMREAFI